MRSSNRAGERFVDLFRSFVSYMPNHIAKTEGVDALPSTGMAGSYWLMNDSFETLWGQERNQAMLEGSLLETPDGLTEAVLEEVRT